jgi:hypothetical protein
MSFYEYAGFAITLNYHPAGRVVINKVYYHLHGVPGACVACGGAGIASRLDEV